MTYMPVANYTTEQTLFKEFIQSDGNSNILLFQGESGSGKSYLIEHCLQTQNSIPSVLVKLQSGSEAIPTLFALMGRQRGWNNLPLFTHTVANLIEQPKQVDDPIWQIGMHRHLDEIRVSPGFMRKSTVRNAKLADFGVVFGKSVLSKLNSSVFAMDPSRYRPSEMV